MLSKLSTAFTLYHSFQSCVKSVLVYDEEDFLQGSVLNHGRIFVFPLLDYLRPRGKTPTTKHIFSWDTTMRCVDNSTKHINYGYGNGIKLFKNIQSKYGFWHNCSKTCIQILHRTQLFKTHPFKCGGGDAAVQDILSFAWFG